MNIRYPIYEGVYRILTVKRLRILWNTQISDLRKAAVKSVPDWHSGICDSDRPVDSRRKSMPVMSTVCEA